MTSYRTSLQLCQMVLSYTFFPQPHSRVLPELEGSSCQPRLNNGGGESTQPWHACHVTTLGTACFYLYLFMSCAPLL